MITQVSWGAVAPDVVVALVTQLVLGIGIGAATFDPGTNDDPSPTALSFGAGIWWGVSGILAAFLGGYTTGRLCVQPKESSGAWHGFAVWALTILVVFYLLTSTVGAIKGGAPFRALGNVVSGSAQVLGTTAQTAVQSAAPQIANCDPLRPSNMPYARRAEATILRRSKMRPFLRSGPRDGGREQTKRGS